MTEPVVRPWRRRDGRAPTRAGTARRYPVPAIREARITAALRAAGYRIPDLQASMAALRQVQATDDPLKSLGSRQEATASRTIALLRAGAANRLWLTSRLRASAGAAVADPGRTVLGTARDHELSWPTVNKTFTAHAEAVFPAQTPAVEHLGFYETRRGKAD